MLKQPVTELGRRIFDSPRLASIFAVVGLLVAGVSALWGSFWGQLVGALVLIALVGFIIAYVLIVGERFKSPYEIIDEQHEWDIVNPSGALVIHRKKMRLRFLQDNVATVYENIWGDGRCHWLHCDPGVFVDEFKTAGKVFKLISLREIRGRGDEQDFAVSCEWRDAFTSEAEWVQVQTGHPTNTLTIRIIFPAGRPSRRVTVNRTSDPNARVLSVDHFEEVSGRQVVTWSPNRPKAGETHTVRWVW